METGRHFAVKTLDLTKMKGDPEKRRREVLSFFFVFFFFFFFFPFFFFFFVCFSVCVCVCFFFSLSLCFYTFFCFFSSFSIGGSLSTLIQKFGKLPVNLIRKYTRDALNGLLYLHSEKYIHRGLFVFVFFFF